MLMDFALFPAGIKIPERSGHPPTCKPAINPDNGDGALTAADGSLNARDIHVSAVRDKEIPAELDAKLQQMDAKLQQLDAKLQHMSALLHHDQAEKLHNLITETASAGNRAILL